MDVRAFGFNLPPFKQEKRKLRKNRLGGSGEREIEHHKEFKKRKEKRTKLILPKAKTMSELMRERVF